MRVRCKCGFQAVRALSDLCSGRTSCCRRCNVNAGTFQAVYADIEPDPRLRKKYITMWHMMNYRCYNKKSRSFKTYGSQGIKVCPELSTLRGYLSYIKTLPGYGVPGLQLDREDNDKGYEVGNLRFVTVKQNCSNRSSCLFLEHKGEKLCATAFREKYCPWVPTTTMDRWAKLFTPEVILLKAAERKETLLRKAALITGASS